MLTQPNPNLIPLAPPAESARIRVLLLEDNAHDAEINIDELRNSGFDPQWRRVETETEFLDAFNEPIDLVLSDYSLPSFDGMRAVELLRARGNDTPFILISGTLGEEIAVTAIKRGADDYLLKHFLTRLGPAVISALNSKRLRDEHRQNEAQLKRFQDQIARALEEKEVLLKEIHHRVKNNLQVISSLLALQSEALADPRARDLLADSQNRVRAMAMIHEKLYQSPDLARVQFDEYVSSLAASLVRSHAHTDGAPELRTELDPVSLSINAAVPCGLILNELVSNALKHAFRDGRRGWIQVRLKIEPRGYSLTVADNGTGLPLGVDGGPSGSLGLQLVDMLARQLKATLTVGSVEGASFKLDFNDDGPKDHGQPSRT